MTVVSDAQVVAAWSYLPLEVQEKALREMIVNQRSELVAPPAEALPPRMTEKDEQDFERAVARLAFRWRLDQSAFLLLKLCIRLMLLDPDMNFTRESFAHRAGALFARAERITRMNRGG